MTQAHLLKSAAIIARCLALHPLIFGFIDGKVWECCPPILHEEEVYCGKDRRHGLKWALMQPLELTCGVSMVTRHTRAQIAY